MNQPRVYMCPHPEPPPTSLRIPWLIDVNVWQGPPSAPALSTLPHASNLDWQSVSRMVIYMLQCYFLKSSNLRLLPESPKVCSLHLCLFFAVSYTGLLLPSF